MASTSHQPDLYHIPRAQKDITRFVWTALGLFTLIVLVSLWASTEYAAWALQWSPMLGKPMLAPAVYFPFDILIWTWKYNSLEYGLAVMKVFENAHLMMGVGGLLSLLMPVALAFRRTRKAAGEKNDLHGSAHWAEPEEVEATGLLPNEKNAGGVFFGDYDEQYLRHAGPEHILAFAPTRSGKGVGIILPTLLSWKHSVLVNDIKGECWHFTAGWRSKALGQRCIKFDPANPGSARFNPLAEIRMDGNLIKDVQNIATMIVDPDGKGLNDHWAKTGFDLMTGIVLFVLLYDPIQDKSLATVQAILSDGGPIRELAEQLADAAEEQDGGGKRMEGSAAVMTAIRDTAHAMLNDGLADEFSAHGWRAAAQAAQSFLNKAGNEASGVNSTALSFLSLYRDPIVAENTRVSDFTLESLMQQATSLYLVVSPSDKDRLKPLLRLILNQTVRRLTESMDFDASGGKSRYPHRLLLAIDEFPSLGKLDVFQEALAFIAGYGMKALLIVQDLSQLYAAYTKDESIISNCHIRIAYAPNKIETAELLSKMAGTATVEHTQRQYSGNRLAVVLQNVNTNEQIVSRPLLTADECMRLPPEDELVFVAGHAPIYAKKIIYYKDPEFAARCAIPAPEGTGRGKD
jgi:type IV secretion system protein VirD4